MLHVYAFTTLSIIILECNILLTEKVWYGQEPCYIGSSLVHPMFTVCLDA